MGKRIIKETNSLIIDLSDYSKGVYFVRIKTESGKLYISKLIKE